MNSTKLKAAVFLSEFACIAPVATLYFLDCGVTLGQVLLAQVFYSLGALLAEVPTGVFADVFGRRLSIIVGHGLSSLCILSYFIIPGAETLYLINLMHGISAGFLSGSTEALLYESKELENLNADVFSKSVASLLSYGTLGFVLATALSTVVILILEESAYLCLIGLTAGAQFTSFIIAISLRESSNTYIDKGVFVSLLQAKKTLTLGVSTVYKSRLIYYLAFAATITNCGEYFLREMFQPLFQSATIPPSYFGFILCSGAFLNFFIMRNSFRIERYLNLPQFLFALYTVIASGYLLLSICSSHTILILSAIVLFALFNVEKPLVSAYVNEQLPDSMRVTTLSTVSLAASVGTILSRLILSSVLDNAGLIAGFATQGIILFIGASLSFWLMYRCNCIRRGGSMVQIHIPQSQS